MQFALEAIGFEDSIMILSDGKPILITLTHIIELPHKKKICICKTKGADQLFSKCTADQRLCFHSIDGMMPLLKSEISSFQPAYVFVKASLCQTWPQGYKTFFMLSSAELEI